MASAGCLASHLMAGHCTRHGRFGHHEPDVMSENAAAAPVADPVDEAEVRARAFAALQASEFRQAEQMFESLCQQFAAEPQYPFGLGMARYGQRAWQPALQALKICCELEPGFVHAWLYRGVIHEQLGEVELAAGAYLHAIRLTDGLDPKTLPHAVNELLNRGSGMARTQLAARLDRVLSALGKTHGDTGLTRIRGGVDVFVGRSSPDFGRNNYRPRLFFVPGLPQLRFHEDNQWAWTAELGRVAGEFSGDSLSLPFTPGGPVQAAGGSQPWALPLVSRGNRVEQHATSCVKLTEFIESLTDLHVVQFAAPNVQLLRLSAGLKMAPRYGSVNARLAVYQVVHASDPGPAGLEVAGELRTWAPGRVRIIDECFDHRLINDDVRDVIVLNFDIWHPALTTLEREAFAAVMVESAEYERYLLGQ